MKWISVKERLPDDGKDYLVTDGAVCMVAAFRCDVNKFDFWTIHWWSNEEVTHWMPLPEPPKQDELC